MNIRVAAIDYPYYDRRLCRFTSKDGDLLQGIDDGLDHSRGAIDIPLGHGIWKIVTKEDRVDYLLKHGGGTFGTMSNIGFDHYYEPPEFYEEEILATKAANINQYYFSDCVYLYCRATRGRTLQYLSGSIAERYLDEDKAALDKGFTNAIEEYLFDHEEPREQTHQRILSWLRSNAMEIFSRSGAYEYLCTYLWASEEYLIKKRPDRVQAFPFEDESIIKHIHNCYTNKSWFPRASKEANGLQNWRISYELLSRDLEKYSMRKVEDLLGLTTLLKHKYFALGSPENPYKISTTQVNQAIAKLSLDPDSALSDSEGAGYYQGDKIRLYVSSEGVSGDKLTGMLRDDVVKAAESFGTQTAKLHLLLTSLCLERSPLLKSTLEISCEELRDRLMINKHRATEEIYLEIDRLISNVKRLLVWVYVERHESIRVTPTPGAAQEK